MRVLFFMTHAGHTRNFDAALRGLAERGHEVIVAVDQTEKSTQPDLNDQLVALVAEYPSLAWERTPDREADSWPEVGRLLRLGLDYLRYLKPEYGDAGRVRDRAMRRAPKPVRKIARNAVGRAVLRRGLRLAERGVPVSEEVERFIRDRAPDIVVVTPLVELGSPQVDYLRAARKLRVPTALLVASWDNLTVKGGIYEVPDLVTVWNEQQRREAVELHDVPSERVAVTGAVAYDHWFDWQPRTTREKFCRGIGLDPRRPYILYAGSSKFIAPHEGRFILDWVKAVRGDSKLKKLQVLVRPHPTNSVAGEAERLLARGNLALDPPEGSNPTDEAARSAYFDAIWHSAAVVGVNTSVMLEASILGRPVHTLLSKQYRPTQGDSLHFKYLLPENGGFVQVAKDTACHRQQLQESLGLKERQVRKLQRPFVESFLRPYGVGEAAAPRLVAALERVAEAGAARGAGRGLLGPPLALAARAATRAGVRRRQREAEAALGGTAKDTV